MVVMEALALGLPFLCHDISGLSVAVDQTCGIKVPLRNSGSSIRGFADAISHLINTPALVQALRRRAAKGSGPFPGSSSAGNLQGVRGCPGDPLAEPLASVDRFLGESDGGVLKSGYDGYDRGSPRA